MAQNSVPTPTLTLGDLVEAEQCVAWSQTLCMPCPECGVEAAVEKGLDMCCTMFEPELISVVQNSRVARLQHLQQVTVRIAKDVVERKQWNSEVAHDGVCRRRFEQKSAF